MISEFYIIAPNCFITKGHTRSVLIDLQRESLRFLNNSQESMLNAPINVKTISTLLKLDKEFIEDLINEDVLLRVPESSLRMFPKMSSQFFNSAKVNNCIIELNNENLKLADRIVNSLTILGCRFVELRASRDISIKSLEIFLNSFSKSTIQSIDIYFEYKTKKTYYELINLKKNRFEIRWLYLYNTPDVFINLLKTKIEPGSLLLKNEVVNKTNCGNISPFYFSINIPTYTEARNYNSCLNCKISIDKAGEIRNCPSMKNSFGNINNISLEDVVERRNFSSMGNIKKDQIKGCKHCEFRYICTDCRAYVEDVHDKYSKPLKCGYDPMTGKWENWKQDLKKQKAIKHYGL